MSTSPTPDEITDHLNQLNGWALSTDQMAIEKATNSPILSRPSHL